MQPNRFMPRRPAFLAAALLAAFAAHSGRAAAEEGAYGRAEALAWHISAYVPCEAGADALGRLRSELGAFAATHEETVAALQLVVADEASCGEVRSLSGELLALSDSRPRGFARQLGLAFEIADSGAGEDAVAQPSGATRRADMARQRAGQMDNGPPPRPDR